MMEVRKFLGLDYSLIYPSKSMKIISSMALI